MNRCVNIDWLEVYALEPISQPRDADYFRRVGWSVVEREYGTPMYHEMFTLDDQFGYAIFEVRRNPKSRQDLGGLFDINGCHIRLSNRACYFDRCAEILQNFLLEHHYTFSRISRLDVCLDFKRFDSGDFPQQFVRRFMEGKYSKINQCELTAHGSDQWAGRVWNSLSWGHKKSMIRTRLYCKSLELTEVKDKPYIRQAWFLSGLVDNPISCTQHNPDGSVYKPSIWRVEFQVSSSVKRWFVIHPDGNENKYYSVRHVLDRYFTREQLITLFDSLQRHYFHFKYYDSHQRKDRCKDKVLFNFRENDIIYKIERSQVASTSVQGYADKVLLKRLIRYRDDHQFNAGLRDAAQVIIDTLEEQTQRFSTSTPYSRDQVKALQIAIAERIRQRCQDPVLMQQHILDVLRNSDINIF